MMFKTRIPLAFFALACVFFLSCDKKQDSSISDLPESVDVVAIYDHFVRGEFSLYIDQMASVDGQPKGYRQQMVNLMKQCYRQLEESHGGIHSYRIIRIVKCNSKYCNAFLEVTYKDNSFNEIILPFVKKDDVWRLK